MSDTGAPPVIPTALQQYDSYDEDPKWQITFTIIWTSVLAFFALLALPAIIRTWRKWSTQIFGVSENWRSRYARVDSEALPLKTEKKTCCGRVHSRQESLKSLKAQSRGRGQVILARVVSVVGSVFFWTPPGINLNAGQFLLIAGYVTAVITCVCTSAPLISNPNRAGFLAIAQLPPVFLFASKNTLLSLLVPQQFAYTRLNVLHRWLSRTMFLAVIIHGSLWIRNHVEWDIVILGEQKETSGVAAFGVLCVIVLTSLRPVRMWAWGIFYWVHFLAVPAFFITVCYHTMFAAPWIIPPVAFYAFDLLMRCGRFRLKDAQLIRVDNQMTLIHIPDCTAGFRAGQHLRIRVFFGGRVFESHPLSIMGAPSTSDADGALTTCLRAKDVTAYYSENDVGPAERSIGPGIILGARVAGDWTRALNEYVKEREREALEEMFSDDDVGSSSTSQRPEMIPVPAQVMFDGPYGGCSLELENWERVLLVAGGSGATFAVGVLDDLVASAVASAKAARTSNGSAKGMKARTRKVHFVWCTRSFGSIKWFVPLLRAITSSASCTSSPVSLRMTVYVTCMCSPEPVDIPGLEVRIGGRPEMSRLVAAMAEDDSLPDGKMGDSEEELCGCGCVDEALENQAKAREEKEKAKEGEDSVVDPEKQEKPRRWDGNLAVCASGPGSLTREAANAVAKYAARGREVGLHTEMFAI